MAYQLFSLILLLAINNLSKTIFFSDDYLDTLMDKKHNTE